MHSPYVLFIMCNVAALTFYATIYEDICHMCNNCREKHVPGTASTAGSLCLWAQGELRSRPTIIKNIIQTLFCTVCLCSIGTPKLLQLYSTLKDIYCVSLELGELRPCEQIVYTPCCRSSDSCRINELNQRLYVQILVAKFLCENFLDTETTAFFCFP